MPQIKSQKKRVLTDEKKRLANKAKKSALKTAIKKVLAAVQIGDKQAALEYYNDANSQLDRLVSARIYHRNHAARQKARLTKAINNIS